LAGFLDSDDTRRRRRAATILAKMDSEEVREALMQAIADPSAEVRSAVLNARTKLFPDDPLLVDLLEDDDAGIRADATRLIGGYYPDMLRALLDDPCEKVREQTLHAIANVDADQIDDVLVDCLRGEIDSSSPELSVAACASLAVIAPQSALEALPILLENANQPLAVRLGALKGLTTIGGDQVVIPLVNVVDDEQRQVRLEAMSALTKLAGTGDNWPNIASSTLLAALRGEYDPDDKLDEAGEEASVQNEPKAEESERRPESEEPTPVEVSVNENFPVSTLDSILDDAPGMAPAVGLPETGIELSDTDMERLAIAKRAIGKKKVKVEPKVARHDDIRRFAARVLGDLDHSEVIDALAASLDTDDIPTCIAAADSLARISARGVHFPENITEIICENLSTDDLSLKLGLIRALAGCEVDEVLIQLENLLGDTDSSIRAEAIRALSGNKQLEKKIENLLADPEPSVRMSAAKAIVGDTNSANLEKLVEFSFSFEGYHGREVARMLRRVSKDRANTAFLNVLGDPDQRRVWSVAIEALEELNSKQTTEV
ncbi:MAG: hypothetical protein GY927_00045, partial [bacterium]|nr:hypothetical protein [bacterium]